MKTGVAILILAVTAGCTSTQSDRPVSVGRVPSEKDLAILPAGNYRIVNSHNPDLTATLHVAPNGAIRFESSRPWTEDEYGPWPEPKDREVFHHETELEIDTNGMVFVQADEARLGMGHYSIDVRHITEITGPRSNPSLWIYECGRMRVNTTPSGGSLGEVWIEWIGGGISGALTSSNGTQGVNFDIEPAGTNFNVETERFSIEPRTKGAVEQSSRPVPK